MHFQNSFRCIFQLPNNEVKHRIEPRQISAFFDMFFSKVTREVQQLIGRKAIPEQTVATQQALVAQDEGTVKADQGQIEAAKLNLAYCHITAPISGRLGLRLVDPGNYVAASSATPLAVITQEDPISVIFTLAEDQLSQVVQRFNHGARLTVDAYDR